MNIRRAFMCLFLMLSLEGLSLQQTSLANEAKEVHVFYGNENIPPMLFERNGQQNGIVVDIFEEIKKYIPDHTLELRLENWQEGQKNVQEKAASGLVQLNINPEREKYLRFSEPLLTSEFVIFHRYDRTDIQNIQDLTQQKVAVEAAGYPKSILAKYPDITPVIVGSWADGFRSLRAGDVDALIVDRWVGEYVLANEKITDIRVASRPVETLVSHIAVRKEFNLLLRDINIALNTIKANGRFQEILQSWSGEKIIYVSAREKELQENIQFSFYAIAFLALILIVLLIYLKGQNKKISDLNDQLAEDVARQNEEIALQRDRLTDIITATHVGTWHWTLKGDELFINEKWAEMIGYSVEELSPITYESWRSRVHPKDLPLAEQKVQEHFNQKIDYYDSDFRMRHKLGHWVWIEARGQVVERAPDGKPVRMSGTHMEITQRKKLEARLRTAEEEASKASKAKSDFLSNMSHEIRTPMMGIRGTLELLKASNLDEKNKDLLDDMDEVSQTLMALLDDVLDISKIEAGKLTLHYGVEEPASIVCGITNIFKAKASAKNILLRSNANEYYDYFCRTDGLRLKQIIGNLINNAVKFTERGEINVDLHVEMGATTDLLHITVADTGIGMNKEQVEKIFNRFEQAKSGMEKIYGGAGLGLAISYELAQLLNAKMTVESQMCEGSTFKLTIPVEPAKEAQKIENSVKIEKLRILLAEDNPINQRITKAMFAKDGHEIDLADDGHGAVEKSVMETYDLILMDMHMPNLDGIGATKAIRQLENLNHETPIIAFTADALDENREKFWAAGVNAIATKPIQYDKLKKIILDTLHPRIS